MLWLLAARKKKLLLRPLRLKLPLRLLLRLHLLKPLHRLPLRLLTLLLLRLLPLKLLPLLRLHPLKLLRLLLTLPHPSNPELLVQKAGHQAGFFISPILVYACAQLPACTQAKPSSWQAINISIFPAVLAKAA